MLPHARSTSNAREMRKALTPPEARLWQALRGKALNGLKFRRQHPIGAFILDFYCVSARLAVEAGGATHSLGDNPRQTTAATYGSNATGSPCSGSKPAMCSTGSTPC